jgi:hypothetical protein
MLPVYAGQRPAIERVVFLLDAPFNARDFQRFGFATFLEAGFSVEIIDLTDLLHPGVREQLHIADPSDFANITPLRSLEDLPRLLGPRDYAICNISYAVVRMPVFQALSRSQARYLMLATNGNPPTDINRPRTMASRLRRLVRRAGARVLHALPLRLHGIRPADAVLAGPFVSAMRLPVADNTHFIGAHTLDYDVYLATPKGRTRQNIAVFLDEYLPFHPDYIFHGITPPATQEEYFPALRRLFDQVEAERGVRVVIAAHPRSDYAGRESLYGGREILRGRTAELVRDADFALTHCSSAVNFAALFDKPMIFLTADSFRHHPIHGPAVPAVAALFGKTPHNIDRPQLGLDWARELVVDQPLRRSYISRFIKVDGTPQAPVWELVAGYLKGLTPSS